jgi:hypothetical protein
MACAPLGTTHIEENEMHTTKYTTRRHYGFTSPSRASRIHPRILSPLFTAMLTLLFAAAAQAQSIDWVQKGTSLGSKSTGYLPRVASDGASTGLGSSTISIYQTGTGFATFEYQAGQSYSLYDPELKWGATPSTIDGEIGHEPSIAMTATGEYGIYNDLVFEAHQGGQDNGAELWYRAGQGSYGIQSYPVNLTWAGAHSYDTGFNPAVALDQSSTLSQQPTIVEVHQAASSASTIWYHVGHITAGSSTPSVSLNGSHSTGFVGYAPTVTVSGNLAILAMQGADSQGTGGALLYSIGQVQISASTGDPTGEIAWGPLTKYDNGYNPSVSLALQYDTDALWVLVEAHQEDGGTGPLWYRIGYLNLGSTGSNPTSIAWQKNPSNNSVATEYDESGCYPSVAQTYFNGLWNVVETNSKTCGEASGIESWFGNFE